MSADYRWITMSTVTRIDPSSELEIVRTRRRCSEDDPAETSRSSHYSLLLVHHRVVWIIHKKKIKIIQTGGNSQIWREDHLD